MGVGGYGFKGLGIGGWVLGFRGQVSSPSQERESLRGLGTRNLKEGGAEFWRQESMVEGLRFKGLKRFEGGKRGDS